VKRALLAWLLATLGLFGCSTDDADMFEMTSETPVVHPVHPGAISIANGVAIAVQPSMIHSDIGGSKALPVTGLRADDPSTLAIIRTSHSYDVDLSPSPNDRSWVLIGLKAGTTKLRLYNDDDEVDVLPVDVIAQVP
jgi:hypothetical protein